MRSVWKILEAIAYFWIAGPGLAQPGADIPIRQLDAVVYFDEDYPFSWITKGAAYEMKEFLASFGFEVLDAAGLQKWLGQAVEKGAKGKLLVMACDVVPKSVVGNDPAKPALFRKYLDSGGTVIWVADVPFYYVGLPNGEKEKWDYLGGRGVLGFDTVGNWKGSSKAQPAGLGNEWGLKNTWISTSIAMKFKGDGSQEVFNPVFVVKNFPHERVYVTIHEQPPKNFRAARESIYLDDVLVVWIGESVRDSSLIRIQGN